MSLPYLSIFLAPDTRQSALLYEITSAMNCAVDDLVAMRARGRVYVYVFATPDVHKRIRATWGPEEISHTEGLDALLHYGKTAFFYDLEAPVARERIAGFVDGRGL